MNDEIIRDKTIDFFRFTNRYIVIVHHNNFTPRASKESKGSSYLIIPDLVYAKI